jgi:hypothetical protein
LHHFLTNPEDGSSTVLQNTGGLTLGCTGTAQKMVLFIEGKGLTLVARIEGSVTIILHCFFSGGLGQVT